MSNQMDINIKWITNNGHILVGETFDDNKTGMNFDREGFNEALVAAEDGLIDAIVVKDLSRLGHYKIYVVY